MTESHDGLAKARSEVYRDRSIRGLDDRDIHDIRILADFIACWCRGQHGASAQEHPQVKPASVEPFHAKQAAADAIIDSFRPSLCPDCADLLGHAISMRMACPMDPKPDCKKCACRCYAPNYQRDIRKVMRYAGWRRILSGRIDYLWHYFF